MLWQNSTTSPQTVISRAMDTLNEWLYLQRAKLLVQISKDQPILWKPPHKTMLQRFHRRICVDRSTWSDCSASTIEAETHAHNECAKI
ncbi:hypothetical protein TSUD_283490 [Trifolium subterraneum]|uniref:Uncharacterized protein n=1 Tax=Trifolium subterraneum TaxID=3900 RepID=A0A2Z6NGG2_TRISU|nr:hypothetical protein TSUD_283490 [Trifolium subterraneum]